MILFFICIFFLDLNENFLENEIIFGKNFFLMEIFMFIIDFLIKYMIDNIDLIMILRKLKIFERIFFLMLFFFIILSKLKLSILNILEILFLNFFFFVLINMNIFINDLSLFFGFFLIFS